MTTRLFFLSLTVSLLFVACNPASVEPEVIIDPVEDMASLSVINVSKQASMPNQLHIDGLFGSNKGITITGSSAQPAIYENIQAGLRKFSIGNHEDTIRIKKHNYYTLMVYDTDSVQLTVDAPYDSNNGFNTLQMIRWNLIGDTPSDYKVDMLGDSLISDIALNFFDFVPSSSKKVELHLYRKSDPRTIVSKYEFEIDLNKKFTVNIAHNGGQYTFDTIVQSTK